METQMLLIPDPPCDFSRMQRRGLGTRRRGGAEARSDQGRHVNSLEAHECGLEKLTKRALDILGWMVCLGRPLTDREVRDGFAPGEDMNYVRPRITDLVNALMLAEVEEIYDAQTHARVRKTAPTERGLAVARQMRRVLEGKRNA